jgi:hypothetical protein
MSESRNVHALYLSDLGQLLKERALEAKAERDRTNDAFQKGRAMAYYEVISLLRHQAGLFQIPLEDLKLSEIDPDVDLIGARNVKD